MTRSAELLLASLIDYAGTFPPSRLTLSDAMAAYARNRRGACRSILGRFVIAADQLGEFESIAPTLATACDGCWSLTVVGTRESMPTSDRLLRFNQMWKNRATIVSVEFAPMPPADVQRVAQEVPSNIDVFFEVASDNAGASLEQIAFSGARAKVRTGGVVSRAFPDAETLAGFLEECRAAHVAFKATAGLHHPIRGLYPVTYDADSPRANMHGFLNVAVAAAFVRAGAGRMTAVDALKESSVDAFVFTDEGLNWRGSRLSANQFADTRQQFFVAFGSCSFTEPVDELVRLGVVTVEPRALAQPHAEVP
jgi:hypothetical protein